MVQQKPIFKIFEKSNMAPAMAIIIDNLQLKYLQKSMRGSEPMGQIFFIFYMKLTYNNATKTHISNFKKIQHCRQ